MSKHRTSKASRCTPAAVKVTEWYCLPVILEAISLGISLEAYRLTHFEEHQARRKEAGICNSTLRREAFEMDALFGVATRERLIKRNPLAYFVMAPKVRVYVPCPTAPEFDRFLVAPKEHYRIAVTAGMAHLTKRKIDFLRARDVAIIAVMGRAGMRPAEVFNLKLVDYQPTENRVIIRIAKDNEWRYAAIYADVITVVDAYLKMRPASESDLLFVSDRGEKIKVDWWSKHFKVFAKIAGRPDITPRGLRHYGITNNAKTNLMAASDAAGHTSLKTTQGYLHGNWEDTKKALAAVPHADVSAVQDKRSSKRVI